MRIVMSKKPATAIEQRYLAKVASLTCLIHPGTPAQVHHLQEGTGISQRSGHGLTIPLCRECHTGAFSIHATPRQFQDVYGTERELLNQTILRVSEL